MTTSKPIHLTYQKALDGLNAAVAAKGDDHRYVKDNPAGGCTYFRSTGEPGCIVGWVLAHYGMEPLDYASGLNCTGVVSLIRNDRVTIEGYEKENGNPYAGLLQERGLYENETYILLSHAQGAQDCGATWKSAVETALCEVEKAREFRKREARLEAELLVPKESTVSLVPSEGT